MNFKVLIKVALLIVFYVKLSLELYATNIIQISPSVNIYYQNRSALILLSSPKVFDIFLHRTFILNDYPLKLKFIIYCKGFGLKFPNPLSLPYLVQPIIDYGYFVQSNSSHLTSSTYFMYSPSHCRIHKIKDVNFFDKALMTWTSPIVFHEKFMNFYGCLVTLGYRFDNEYCEFRLKDGKLLGYIFDFFDIMAGKANFTKNYKALTTIGYEVPEKFRNSSYQFLKYDVTLNAGSLSRPSKKTANHITVIFHEREQILYITPSESYSSYEKLILPFDATTWTLLLITFGISFIAVFFISFTTRKIQDIVYGYNVTTPAFNIVSIFFGVAQFRVPTENFSRIILVIFIFFCLIIRTAYQGVQFDMMTNDIRKPLPKTFPDLKRMGYTIVYKDVPLAGKYLKHFFPHADR
jgi:hypothetical protein